MAWEILGHEWAVELLQGHLSADRVRHAYLLTGPPGIGRRTLALRFTQALLCTQPPTPGGFCGTCRECRQTDRMQHPDLTIVQTEEASGIIKVDQVRELQRGLHLAPYQARYKVALLLNFEKANLNAANALLKILEEPPDQVILLLTAASPERLLPTIVSRCEVLRLRPQPAAVVQAGLEGQWGVPQAQAHLLARVADGRPGFARTLVEDPTLLEQREVWLEDLLRLIQSGRVERFAYVEPLAKEPGTLQAIFRTWLSFWRDILLRAADPEAELSNPDRTEEITALAAQIDLPTAHHTVSALDRTISLLDRNINKRLAAEVLMLEIPFLTP